MLSVIVYVCVPAGNALGLSVPQLSDKVPVPPLRVRFAIPSFPPLQLTSVVVAETEIATGSSIVTVSCKEQLLVSLTVTI